MTTKEEKARLQNIRMLMVEVVNEIDEILNKAGVTMIYPDDVKKEKKETPVYEPKKDKVQRIGDLNIGDEQIVIEGEVLDITANSGTKAGKAWEVKKLTISDGTGPIKLCLWNEQTAHAENVTVNDVVRVHAWKVEKGYKGGVHELVYGQYGSLRRVNHPVERHII